MPIHPLLDKNDLLEQQDAEQRIAITLEHFDDNMVLSSSFGIQAAVMLHMVTQQKPKIPVLLVDTGYLFPETYRFIDELSYRLQLNLKVYRSQYSAAWQEARYGKLWEQGIDGINRYNDMNKVEPMRRALDELGAEAWFSGIRRAQASTRNERPVVEEQNGRVKVYPIIDWSDREIYNYLKQHDLPYHPLNEKGYASVGDWHSSRPLGQGESAEDTRFQGVARECGLHTRT